MLLAIAIGLTVLVIGIIVAIIGLVLEEGIVAAIGAGLAILVLLAGIIGALVIVWQRALGA